ncbi:thiamine pyrophosphate-binding protein [Frankia gtarii]|uniref:thiamine pyrophosphate-binding protein n=1 Tax=Frankia gtarii TaxID=2950102 RepID=UPI0021C238C1|nr:thiamine pyrophosphate-binding protein [Frankia gtarii]
MAFGDLLRRLGVPYLVTPHGGPDGPATGLPCYKAPDLASALLLAEAEGSMGAGLGAVLDGEVLTLLSRPVVLGEPTGVASAEALLAAAADARRRGAGGLAVRLEFDLSDLVGARHDSADDHADPSLAARLTPSGTAGPCSDVTLVDFALVGRGVFRTGGAPAVRAFAERTGVGVLNTFTTKGLFRWDSPFHLGTGCLQEQDLVLAGAHPDAVILTIGVDADECPDALFAAAGFDPGRAIGVAVDGLGEAARTFRARVPVGGERGRLYRELGAVAQPLYPLENAPLNPARAAADIAAVLPENASVWVEPGPAGMWLARALPTTRFGSARVPAAGTAGVAVAGALSAALRPGGVGVAVLDEPPRSGAVATLLEWASSAPGTVVVEVWGGRGGLRCAQEHRERLAAVLARPGVSVLEVPVDYSATTALLEAAGPVVAWRGPAAAASSTSPDIR